MSSFARTLATRVEDYITLRRSLGYSFQEQAATLRALVQYAEIEQLDGPLTRDMALNFVFSWDGTANGRAIRHGVIRRFCEYLAIYDPRTEALDPRALPRSRAIPPPRILTDDAARITHVGVPPCFAGLSRAGYGVDGAGWIVGEHRFAIGRGASPRSRRCRPHRRRAAHPEDQVPQGSLGPDPSNDAHGTAQLWPTSRRSLPGAEEFAFFLSSRGNRLSSTALYAAFDTACELAGLGCDKGLRPHELRHRFAVTRLAVWHQEKADVQALLPLLATYLGHARYTDTVYYITDTAELLGMAADRAVIGGGAA